MRKSKFQSISNWLVEKRKKRRAGHQIEKEESRDLDFLNVSSGYTCIPYRWSDTFCEYVNSFAQNLQVQLERIQLDEFNGSFKDKEIELMCNYEKLSLERQLILHKFENRKIDSQLMSRLELLEKEVKIIETGEKILEMKEDEDYEKM